MDIYANLCQKAWIKSVEFQFISVSVMIPFYCFLTSLMATPKYFLPIS